MASTWATLSKDLNQAGVNLFIKLFTAKPEYQELFSFRGVPLEQLPKDRRLKAHARNVMYTLSMIVGSLEEADVLQEMVHKVAVSHLRRHLTEEHFLGLKGAFVAFLGEALGSGDDAAVLTAWAKTFDLFLVALREEEEAKKKQV